MGSLLNYTAVTEKYSKYAEGLKILENLKLAPRKVFTGVKVLREGRSGLYNETSTLQQEKWHQTFDQKRKMPVRSDA